MSRAASVDKSALLAWLDARAAERRNRDATTSALVQYAIYQGLRDKVARGDFDEVASESAASRTGRRA